MNSNSFYQDPNAMNSLRSQGASVGAQKIISPKIQPLDINNKEKVSDTTVQMTTDRNVELFKLEEYKQKSRCTFFAFGNIPVNQEYYYCEICDPNKTEMICFDCFFVCHKYCNKDEMKEEETKEESPVSRKDNKIFFICECGKKKHEIERKNDKELEKKCQFSEFDSSMKRRYRTICKTCNIPICYICYINCHRRKTGCQVEKIIINPSRTKPESIPPCACVNQKHSSIITTIQIINRTVDREEYEESKNLWSLQLFNVFCMTKISNDLFEETATMICDFKNDSNFKKNQLNVCNRFLRLGKMIFKTKNFFYFRDSFVSQYPYKKLVEVILSFNPGQYEKYGNFICALCFFFYFLHLKKDFQSFKGMCIYDFVISSPLDRIMYKKLINSRNIYTYQIYDKYFDVEKGKYCLGDICINLLNVLQNAINDFGVKKLDKCLKNYFTIFKIVYFCLKRFLFDFDALERFVDVLLKLCSDIYHFIVEHSKTEKNLKEFKGFLKVLMTYITKINCAIVFNYNDMILSEIIFIKKKKYSEYSFLHLENNFSNKIIKTVIITSLIYGTFTINDDNINKQFLFFLNNIIETMILTNNIYLKKLNEGSFESFKNFYEKIKTLSVLENCVNYVNKVPCDEVNYTPCFIEMKVERTFEEKMRRVVFNLKHEIEMKFTMFFHHVKSINELEEEISKLLVDFAANEFKAPTGCFNSTRNKIENPVQREKEKEKEISNSLSAILKREQIKKFKKKIRKNLASFFSFFKYESISQETVDVLIDEFILSSFATSLTKILMIDKSLKSLREKKIEVILNFLTILFLNKEGTRNLCLGRNLKRIMKSFSVFPRVTLKLLNNFFKAVYLYEINISQHDKIPLLIDEILTYLDCFPISKIDDENKFKIDFFYSVKIFNNLVNILTIDQLKDIQRRLADIIIDKKITEVKHFGIILPLYFIYSKDGHIEREAEPNIRYIGECFQYVTKKPKESQKSDEGEEGEEENNESLSEENKGNKKKEKKKSTRALIELYKSELLAKYLVKLKEVFAEKPVNQNGDKTEFIRPLNIDTKITTKINEKFLFAFLSMLSLTTFSTEHNAAYELASKFLDIEFLQFLLKRRYLTLKYRIILLEFLGIYVLSEDLKKTEKYPNSTEYIKIVQSKKSSDKLKEVNDLKIIIEIFDNEMSIMHFAIHENRDKMIYGLMYVNVIIASLKKIANIFITYDITSHTTLWFYQIVLKFLQKNQFIKNFLMCAYKGKVNEIDYLNYEDPQGSELDLEKKDYDIYDKDDLFLKFLVEFQRLYNETKYNDDFNLNKFLTFYNNTNDMDFKIFSLTQVPDEISSITEKQKDSNDILVQKNTININNLNKKITLVQKGSIIKKDPFEKAYIHFRKAISLYIKEFVNLSKLSLINIIFTKSNDITIEFKDIFFDYIVNAINHIKDIKDCNITALIILTNKILFFDYEKTQNFIWGVIQKNNRNTQLEKNGYKFEELLFENNKQFLDEIISMQIITSKTDRLFERHKNFTIISKNIIQFFQLLGEGHSKVFQPLLVNGTKNRHTLIKNRTRATSVDSSEEKNGNPSISNPEENLSIFNVLCNSLNTSLKLLNLFTNDEINGELPYDKLIVPVRNIIDCVIEFFQGSNREGYIDMYSKIKICFDSMKSIINLKIPNESNPRRKFIIILKTSLLQLISSLVEEGCADDPEINSLKDIMVIFQPLDLYDEIVLCFDSIYETFSDKCEGYELSNIKIKGRLIELYKFDHNFQLSIELKLAFQIFYILRIIEEIYNRVEVVNFFKRIENGYFSVQESEKKSLLGSKKELQKEKTNLFEEGTNSKTSKPLSAKKTNSNYNSSNQKENKISENEETNSENTQSKLKSNQNNSQSAAKISKDNLFPGSNPKSLLENAELNQDSKKSSSNKNSMKVFMPQNQNIELQSVVSDTKQFIHLQKQETKEEQSLNYITLSKKKYVIYSFLSETMRRIEIKNDVGVSVKDYCFFIVPPICFLLCEPTKISFSENVDRDTVSTKILSLIDETDYFIYEMFYNKARMKSFSKVSTYLANLNLKKFEYVNFFFILVLNILLVIHNFSFEPIPDDEKLDRYLDIIIVCVLHVLLIFFVMFIWIKYKFELQYKHKIMLKYKERFIFSRGENRDEQLTESEESLMEKLGVNLTFMQKLSVIAKDTVLSNREINIFVFTFLFIVLYFIFSNSILLSIPLLFIANSNDILFGIIFSLQLRFKQLLIVLIYTYIIVYIFSWITFYYFTELFEFDDLYDNQTKLNNGTEYSCSSMPQCFMFLTSYGVRSGGGIGDVLPKISYVSDPGYYIGGFFYVVIFHIFIIWIMLNLFFGIIVDTFAALREKTYRTEEDKLNICYICQMTRDSAMNKNINFDLHVNNIHCIWNYVYFMTYLHINNSKNFKSLETFVWDKIPKNDTSWLPIDEGDDDEDK